MPLYTYQSIENPKLRWKVKQSIDDMPYKSVMFYSDNPDGVSFYDYVVDLEKVPLYYRKEDAERIKKIQIHEILRISSVPGFISNKKNKKEEK